MVGVLVLVAVLAFSNLAASDGDAKVAEFWGNRVAARELAIVHETRPAPPPLVVFGVPVAQPERKE